MEVQSRASGHPGPHNCATLNSSVCARGSIYCSDDQPPQNKTCQRYSSNAVSQPHTVNYFRFKISHITMCTNHTRTSHTHVIDIKAISGYIVPYLGCNACQMSILIKHSYRGCRGWEMGARWNSLSKATPPCSWLLSTLWLFWASWDSILWHQICFRNNTSWSALRIKVKWVSCIDWEQRNGAPKPPREAPE